MADEDIRERFVQVGLKVPREFSDRLDVFLAGRNRSAFIRDLIERAMSAGEPSVLEVRGAAAEVERVAVRREVHTVEAGRGVVSRAWGDRDDGDGDALVRVIPAGGILVTEAADALKWRPQYARGVARALVGSGEVRMIGERLYRGVVR